MSGRLVKANIPKSPWPPLKIPVYCKLDQIEFPTRAAGKRHIIKDHELKHPKRYLAIKSKEGLFAHWAKTDSFYKQMEEMKKALVGK